MAALGLPVFPLRPGTKDGMYFRSWKAAATTDPDRIRAFAARWPHCNFGARCVGHLVLDVDVADGKAGEEALLLVDAMHGLPTTRVNASARGGQHWLLKLPEGVEVSNRDKPLGEGINVRGAGGYVVCPGSVFIDEHGDPLPYTVQHEAPVAMAPASLVEILKAPPPRLGAELPDERQDHPSDIATAIDWLLNRPVVLEGERGSHIYKAAARCRDWGLSQPVTLELVADYYGSRMEPPLEADGCRHEVASAFRYSQNSVGAASVFNMFEDATEVAEYLQPPPDAAPRSRGEDLRWPAVNDDGKPIGGNQRNIQTFLRFVGARLSHCKFTGRHHLAGYDGFDGSLTDAGIDALWLDADRNGLRCPPEKFRKVLTDTAGKNPFHPVRDYLNGLQWDGNPRAASWLATYCGADDTELTREFGRLWLVAAVRRIRQPGCKFDQVLVLEGDQGAGKSSVFARLAGQWGGDSVALTAEPKVLIEQTRGKWIIEIPELSGLRGRDTEHVKSLIARTDDTARLAYAREPETVKREFVLGATTNDDQYLIDPTGNRRFWPVKVGVIDLEALSRDRDQLWAEAAAIEASGCSITLDPSFYAEAEKVQGLRRQVDPFHEVLEPIFGEGRGYVLATDVYPHLGFSVMQGKVPSQNEKNRANAVMRQLGWRRDKQRYFDGKPRSMFVKWPEDAAVKPPPFNPSNPAGLALVAFDDAEAAAADLLS